MQIGEVIMWVGLPQLFIMPFVAKLSSTVDNRILCSIGLLLFGGSCMMNAYMDASTGYDQLLWSQVVRALGQPFVMLTLSNFAMKGIAPKDMASASSLFNMTRNLGGSIGIALLATALSTREHFHSQRTGEAINAYSSATQLRIDQLTSSFMAKGYDAVTAGNQALQAIDGIVRREAYVMAYNDGFFLIGAILLACIVPLWLADKLKAPVAVAAVIDRARKHLKNKKVHIMNTVMTKIAAAASLAVLLAACGTVGQDFKAPANLAGIDMATFRHGAGSADAAQLPAEWWNVFGDDTLNRLECRAARQPERESGWRAIAAGTGAKRHGACEPGRA